MNSLTPAWCFVIDTLQEYGAKLRTTPEALGRDPGVAGENPALIEPDILILHPDGENHGHEN
jgi:hypothetical protein